MRAFFRFTASRRTIDAGDNFEPSHSRTHTPTHSRTPRRRSSTHRYIRAWLFLFAMFRAVVSAFRRAHVAVRRRLGHRGLGRRR